jgi:hypothetical protein
MNEEEMSRLYQKCPAQRMNQAPSVIQACSHQAFHLSPPFTVLSLAVELAKAFMLSNSDQLSSALAATP